MNIDYKVSTNRSLIRLCLCFFSYSYCIKKLDSMPRGIKVKGIA